MKVYIDLVLFVNFAFDFILLQTTSIILKRRVRFIRLVLGSLVGSLTIFILFVPVTTLTLFIFKVFLSVVISIVTFGFKDIRYTLNNLFYFYVCSIILGGFLYYLNIEFSYKNIGMVFFHKGLSINYLFILFAGPLVMLVYRKEMKRYKNKISLMYKVNVYMPDKRIVRLNGFMDTGNTLVDPISKNLVIISNHKDIIKYVNENNFYLIPYDSVNSGGFMRCFKVRKIYVEGIGLISDVIIGVTNKKLNSNGVDCILNYLIMEERL